ncbi:hypothetical protein GLOIN_2v1886485 [Rhizophagus irregularis DAOM 181602=DAOM 197198]|nr:hypothetical protein GLOIN_2v1886485 [Rhizophagus irregularis DAOM 181602=DAOM 197198]
MAKIGDASALWIRYFVIRLLDAWVLRFKTPSSIEIRDDRLSLRADGSGSSSFPLTNWGFPLTNWEFPPSDFLLDGFLLSIWGFPPSDFIGLCFPFGFYQIGLGEDDGWMVDGGWCI